MSKNEYFVETGEDDRFTIRVNMTSKEDFSREDTIEKKWNTTPRNRRIIRWKLLQTLQDLLTKDYDRFVSKVGENEELMELLLGDKKVYQYNLSDGDEDEKELKYGLERTRLWEDLMRRPGKELQDWQIEYEDSLIGDDPFQ